MGIRDASLPDISLTTHATYPFTLTFPQFRKSAHTQDDLPERCLSNTKTSLWSVLHLASVPQWPTALSRKAPKSSQWAAGKTDSTTSSTSMGKIKPVPRNSTSPIVRTWTSSYESWSNPPPFTLYGTVAPGF